MADETTINSNNYSYPLYADSHPKFGADAKESSSTIQKPETALTKQAPNDGGNDSDWAATLSANFQAKHGAKQQSTLHPESRDFIAQRVLRQDSNATLVDFARRMSRSDTSKIQLEVTSPINSTAPSVLPKFQLEVTAPTSSSIPLKSSKLSHEWDNASPFGKTDGHPNLNLIPSDNGDITRNRRQSSDATLVEGGSWMRRDSAGHESWRGRLGSDTSTIASRRASRTKLRQGSAPWAPLLPDVPEPGYFESDRMKIDKSFTFSTPLIVERDPLKGIARPPSIEDEDESSVDPLSQIRVAPQEPAVDLLPAHYDPEPVVQDPFTDKMYPVIENPVDPARQLKRKDLINQRVLFSSAILSVNTAMLIVALVAPARTSGIWVLAFICFIKAKDCLSSVIACIDITVKAIYRLFKPLPAVESKWILSLIPAFSESEEQIVKTVFSLRDNNVAPHKQVMAIVLDGKQRDIKQHMRITRSFRRHYVTSRFKRNELIINAGFMEDVPVICFEKAKNAGKKDSLILCHDLFNVMRDNAPLYTKLLREDIWDDVLPELVGADFPGFDMVFCTDADSTIHKGAVKDLADAIGRDSKSIAACGLVLVELEEGEEWSFWNLYQQFQYNFGQFVRRQAESSWGKVTCLPGCVTMIAVRPEMAGAIRKYAEPITGKSLPIHSLDLSPDLALTSVRSSLPGSSASGPVSRYRPPPNILYAVAVFCAAHAVCAKCCQRDCCSSKSQALPQSTPTMGFKRLLQQLLLLLRREYVRHYQIMGLY